MKGKQRKRKRVRKIEDEIISDVGEELRRMNEMEGKEMRAWE